MISRRRLTTLSSSSVVKLVGLATGAGLWWGAGGLAGCSVPSSEGSSVSSPPSIAGDAGVSSPLPGDGDSGVLCEGDRPCDGETGASTGASGSSPNTGATLGRLGTPGSEGMVLSSSSAASWVTMPVLWGGV